MSAWLDQFESLDVIGNGSFGVIRKVRRKGDGQIFARKDLDFSRMTERDRRQIVAEVNILKDLHNPHIVRYHDRHVDRDAGTLHILMEYCGGGDLSSVIKRASREAERSGVQRGLEEEKVWAYLMQILRALAHCHHPNSTSGEGSHSRSNSLGGSGDGETRRSPVLHRDLKPDNVFLDEQNNVKLGDFGLSKALAQAAFANTYVGTPYYMSPEVMQEKAYDSKSDIWSLGCLVYEMCALRPPFHEAKTHAELSAFIRNGRIPPLPRGYSSTLSATIKAMLNLNPAMRPSALQLLQHERVDYAVKVDETEKLIANVKAHKAAVVAREREVTSREQALLQRDAEFRTLGQRLSEAQAEATRLQGLLTAAQSTPTSQHMDEAAIEQRIRAAVAAREEQLRLAVRDHEGRVRAAMQAREAELLEAVNKREEQLQSAWAAREADVLVAHAAALAETRDLAERARSAREEEITRAWEAREAEVAREWEAREEEIRKDVEAREAEVENIWREREEEIEKEWEARLNNAVAEVRRGTISLKPLEEVQNVLDTSSSTDVSSTTTDEESDADDLPQRSSRNRSISALFQTPVPTIRGTRKPNFKTPLPALTQQLRAAAPPPTPRDPVIPTVQPKVNVAVPGSAMRGVVLTSTGETLATPGPAEFVRVFGRPMRGLALDFSTVFDEEFKKADESQEVEPEAEDEVGNDSASEATPRVGMNGLHAATTFHEELKSPSGRVRSNYTLSAPLSPSKLSGVRIRPASPSKRATATSSASSVSALRRAPSTASLKRTTSASGTTRASVSATASLSAATRLKRHSTALPDVVITAGPSTASTSSAISASTSNSSSGSDVTRKTAAAPPAEKAVAPRKLMRAATVATIESAPVPQYNLEDEENLPSPFLRKIDRERIPAGLASRGKLSLTEVPTAPTRTGMSTRSKSAAVTGSTAMTAIRRQSNAGHGLRAVAAANAAAVPIKAEPADHLERPAIASARRAADSARQRLKA